MQSAVLDGASVDRASADGANAGRDLLVSAQTGSGKTVAYGLAFAPDLLGPDDTAGQPGSPRALVIAPTRELALQVHGELSWLYARTGARVVSCVGGMDARGEQRRLAAGCHIVVGTPGRLCDHLRRGQLDPGALRAVVLDEADEMLDLGFQDELRFILDATPPERRTLLFSATIARDIVGLARQYQRDALRVDTVDRSAPHADIEYRAMRTVPYELDAAVANVLRYVESPAALVFCATREGVRRMHGALVRRRFAAVALSGEMSQADRNEALQALRDGRARVCIATDVAARGLDLPDLDLVVHADLPTNPATLLHRSGRTGRAGRKGLCVLLVPPSRRAAAVRLAAAAGVAVAWSGPPSAAEIAERDRERLLADPVWTGPPSQAEQDAAATVLAAWTPEQVAVALLRLREAALPLGNELTGSGLAQDPAPPAARPKRRDDPGRHDGGPMSWFRMELGRRDRADPKWLIPALCRLGGLTKRDIGTIQVFEKETRFQVTLEATPRFAAAAARGGRDIPPVEQVFSTSGNAPVRNGTGRPGGRRSGSSRIKPPKASAQRV